MGGRHRTAVDVDGLHEGRQTRRHQRRKVKERAMVIPVVIGVLAAGTATAFAATTGALGCLGSRTDLAVSAAPDIAPALDKIAGRFRNSEAGQCVDVTVTPNEPDQVAQALKTATPGDSNLLVPDVWVPNSSLWLDNVRAGRQDSGELAGAASIAHSPLVVAMVRPLADRLGWEQAKLSWTDLIKQAGQSDTALQLGLVDPTRSAASTHGLVAIRNATAKPGAQLVQVGAMRALSTNVATTERSLLDQLPRSAAELGDPSLRRIHAFPSSEQGVWRYNVTNPPIPLAAVYPSDGAPQLDYPYVQVRAREDGDRRRAAQDFQRAIQSAAGRKAIQEAAFRTVDDRAGVALSPVYGARQQKAPGAYQPRTADVDQMWRVWSAVNLNARMLAVIDVSGSMLKVDPGTTRSRIALTREAAAQGLGLLGGASEVGLWVFSTKMTRTTDYAQVLDVGRLNQSVGSATRRDILLTRLGGLAAKKDGGTGLYDTALAAYRKMVSSYKPKAFNSVVLMTDGKNDNASSITLPQLVAELKRLRDPKKPVPMYTIGFSNEVDPAALKAMADATGGVSAVTTNPLSIRDVFLRAIAKRACADQACPR
jgi:Ca-activated chloride channel homolog